MTYPSPLSVKSEHGTSGPALCLESIDIAFERPAEEPLTIVTGFNLALHRGAMHCLAGRSGSGKTSLLRVAAGLQQPTSGTVSWIGQPLRDLTPQQLAGARRSHMGYVDQGATLIGELNVIDNVLLPAVPTGVTAEAEERALELLALFHLRDRARQQVRSLSGGERQRVAIARALLLSPTALAVDEPTASLDRASAGTVIAALQQAARDGCAVLVASHDPALIAAAGTNTQLD